MLKANGAPAILASHAGGLERARASKRPRSLNANVSAIDKANLVILVLVHLVCVNVVVGFVLVSLLVHSCSAMYSL